MLSLLFDPSFVYVPHRSAVVAVGNQNNTHFLKCPHQFGSVFPLSSFPTMSSRIRNRAGGHATSSSSPLDAATTSVNERILRECHSLYTDPTNGLVQSAEELGLKLLPPRKKITIMLIGNHSAGKSSFINW